VFGSPLDVSRRAQLAEERLRAQLSDFLPRGSPDGRVRRDEKDALGSPVLGCEALDQRVGVLGVTHLQRSQLPIMPYAVEHDDAARAAHRDEARELVRELPHVLELARVQKVVAVEEVEGWVGHLRDADGGALPASLEEEQRGRDADIERRHAPAERDRHLLVARLADERAQAPPFGAEHERHTRAEIRFPEPRPRLGDGAPQRRFIGSRGAALSYFGRTSFVLAWRRQCRPTRLRTVSLTVVFSTARLSEALMRGSVPVRPTLWARLTLRERLPDSSEISPR
jgi:hypothetical protein